MISNLIVAIEAVAPMFIIIFIGAMIRKVNIITEAEAKRFNKVVFICCFPPLMFNNLYGKNIGDAVNLRLLAYAVITVLVLYAVTVIVVLKVEKAQKTRGAMIQAIYRSNFVIMGIPIVQNVFGKGDLALTAVLVTVVVPMYNILAVITLEVFRGGKPSFREMVRDLAKNPIIIGAFFGILSIVFSVKLPPALEMPIELLADAATPMALLMLGASFNFSSVSREKRNLIICLTGRLLLFPLVGITGAILLGFRGVAIMSLLAMFASPSAITSFTMAQQMDSDYELAGNAVIFSSAISCITMFLWIFVLKTMGMF